MKIIMKNQRECINTTVEGSSSQDLQHKAWEHQLLQSFQLVRPDTQRSPQLLIYC